MTLSERDHSVVWHPFTQHKTSSMQTPIVRGEGAYLIDENNNRILDLISSWWVNLHGHAHPEIAKAIYTQAMQLEHTVFSGFTHEPAIQLAEQLLEILPPAFSKIFYTDNGSTAVESALKIAYQYWHNRGEKKRQRFIGFKNGYHGDTFGAMSVGKKSGFFAPYEDLFFSVDFFSYPSTWTNDSAVEKKEQAVLTELDQHLKLYADETAAMILEPLVQGAGGMQMCRPEFLQQLEQLVRSHGVLIIYDEVMTGFGRTGEYFACLKANTTPDIICLSKGITGGFLPLAVTACQEFIYQGFLSDSIGTALLHGHSYTAHPIGCAAALASLKILKSPEVARQQKMIENTHRVALSELRDTVDQQRYCGTIAAFNLKMSPTYGSNVSEKLRKQLLKKGLLLRPLGNVIYFLPPYCISEADLKNAYAILIEEIQGVTA
ncbi:MAG: adenosylmethionine--8-amino-7-oxononanoate transaminase [Gammaproteobacteria bacterium]